MFEHKDGCMAVEVKAANANDADLERGIYQCVKYRALLRAELKAEGKILNGSSLLIIEAQLSSSLQALADLLVVRVVVVPAKRETAKRGKKRIRLEGGGYRRDHLRALAQRVEVSDGEVRIMGSKSRLLQVLTEKNGVILVPTQD